MSPLVLIFFVFATAVSSLTETRQETTTEYSYKPPKLNICKFPGKPANGRYVVQDPPYMEPGQAFDKVTLELECDLGFGVKNERTRYFCFSGMWSWIDEEPVCERFCGLPKDDTIEYRCPLKVYPPKCYKYGEQGTVVQSPCPVPEGADKGYRPCKDYEPDGTIVQPVNVKTGASMTNMTCLRGHWNSQGSLGAFESFSSSISIVFNAILGFVKQI